MKAEELLKLAKAALEEKRNEEGRRTETGKDIGIKTETIEQYIRGEFPDEGDVPTPKEAANICKATLAQRGKLEKQKKVMTERIRKLKSKLEAIILEEGEYAQPELPIAGGGKKK